jgi:nitric oxide synthase oxygenase domain/subunit
MREIPPDICPMIEITHSDHAELFEEYKLKWYAIPALCNQVLEIGGIDYTCAPFNGWYMSTEISARNLTDPYRYDLAQKMAFSLGLDTESNRSLWRDKI